MDPSGLGDLDGFYALLHIAAEKRIMRLLGPFIRPSASSPVCLSLRSFFPAVEPIGTKFGWMVIL